MSFIFKKFRMSFSMKRCIWKQLKIFYSIIVSNAINMVHDFFGFKVTTKMFLHYKMRAWDIFLICVRVFRRIYKNISITIMCPPLPPKMFFTNITKWISLLRFHNPLLWILIIAFLLTNVNTIYAQDKHRPALLITEDDRDPEGRPRIVIWDNGTLTDNGNGSFSIFPASASGVVANYVPYVGAIKDVDLGSKNFTTTGTTSTGGFIASSNFITINYTIASNDYVVLASASSAITLLLNPAAGNTGRIYHIKNLSSDSNNVTIDPNAGETIDEETTLTLTTQYQSVSIQSDGSNWWIF